MLTADILLQGQCEGVVSERSLVITRHLPPRMFLSVQVVVAVVLFMYSVHRALCNGT
jgi:hypothetical protein